MPLTEQIQLDHGCKLALWKITEEEVILLNQLSLVKEEQDELETFKSITRRKEFLISRLMIQKILGEKVLLLHNSDGKPYLQNSEWNISISHTKELVGILLGKYCDIALDIEYLSDRVKKVATRFLSREELQYVSSYSDIRHLYKYWCAKECLIKLEGKRNMHLTRELFIKPFSPGDNSFTGIIRKGEIQKEFTFQHREIDNHLLVWCCQLKIPNA